jgi:fructokinase
MKNPCFSPAVQHVSPAEFDRILKMVLPAQDGAAGSGPVYSERSGGGAANAAKIAALLGIRSAFTGTAGRDAYGDFFEKELKEAGALVMLRRTALPTGRFLRVNSACIIASPAAALEYGESDINEDLIRDARLVMFDGYMLDRRPLARRVFDAALKYKKVLALDIGSAFHAKKASAFIVRRCREQPLILFLNEEEAGAFAGEAGLKSVRELAEAGTAGNEGAGYPVVAVKRGGRGAVVHIKNKTFTVKTKAIRPLDSTGAGDAFAAGFLAAFVRNKTAEECAASGNSAAARFLAAMEIKRSYV